MSGATKSGRDVRSCHPAAAEVLELPSTGSSIFLFFDGCGVLDGSCLMAWPLVAGGSDFTAALMSKTCCAILRNKEAALAG